MESRAPIHRPSLKEVRGGKPWSKAEEQLLAECNLTKLCVIGFQVPKEDEKDKFIRGALIRFLLLGGDEEYRPSPSGVQVNGAVISHQLDLGSELISKTRRLQRARWLT